MYLCKGANSASGWVPLEKNTAQLGLNEPSMSFPHEQNGVRVRCGGEFDFTFNECFTLHSRTETVIFMVNF